MAAFDEDGDSQPLVLDRHGTAAAIRGRGHVAALCGHTSRRSTVVSQSVTAGDRYSLCHGAQARWIRTSKSPPHVFHSKTRQTASSDLDVLGWQAIVLGRRMVHSN